MTLSTIPYKKFMQLLIQQKKETSEKELRQKKRTLSQMQKRIADLDRIFKRIYEDEITEAISHERFVKLSSEYEAEQAELKAKAGQLEKELSNFEQEQFNFKQFTAVIRKYVGIREVQPETTGKRVQRVQIVFNFVGEVELPDSQGGLEAI